MAGLISTSGGKEDKEARREQCCGTDAIRQWPWRKRDTDADLRRHADSITPRLGLLDATWAQVSRLPLLWPQVSRLTSRCPEARAGHWSRPGSISIARRSVGD